MAFISDSNFSWIQNNTRDYAKDPSAKNFFAGTWDMDRVAR